MVSVSKIKISVEVENGRLVRVCLDAGPRSDVCASLDTQHWVRLVEQFLSPNPPVFDWTLVESGTDFQRAVWREIAAIPFGETITYKELARRIHRPTAFRAVANACGVNRFPLMIPCHRVVGSYDIGGFAFGKDLKKQLLTYEASFSSSAAPSPVSSSRPS